MEDDKKITPVGVGTSQASEALRDQLVRLATASATPGRPVQDTYSMLRLRYGGTIGKLIASLSNNPYHPDSPYGVPKSLQELLARLAHEKTSSGVTIQRAMEANELLENMRRHLRHVVGLDEPKPGTASKEKLPQPTEDPLKHLVKALDAEDVDDDDVVIRLLASDKEAAQRALQVSPETHPELYETLILALLSHEMAHFVGSGTLAEDKQPVRDTAPKRLSEDEPPRDEDQRRLEEEQQKDETPEKRRDRLAALLAERARYVIPRLTITHAPNPVPTPRDQELISKVDKPHEAHDENKPKQ